MSAFASDRAGVRAAGLRTRIDQPALAAWLLPFAAVTYLALERGGYDPIVRGQVGIAAWWIVLVGAVAGLLPSARLSRPGWAGLGLMAAFVAWTALSLGWTESEHRTADELGKVAGYAGLFTLTLAIAGRTAARHALNGLACAIGLVALLAVLSRLQPALFPQDDLPRFFGDHTARRLSYPLNYWNGLAAFIAMGLPLMLRAAAEAQSLAGRVAAAAAVPVMALAIFLTVSRGGAVAVAVAVIAWFLIGPGRLNKLASLLVAAAGSGIVVAGADQRDALQTGLRDAVSASQGDDLLAMLIVVCLGVGFLQLGVGLIARHVAAPRWTVVPRSRGVLLGGGAVVAAVVVALAAGLPGQVDREWQQFKELNPAPRVEGGEDSFARLQSVSGNGRYQYWQQAAEAQETRPLGGIGAGTFEFWWARNATHSGGFVRDAHSLYVETFAELGLIGLLLLGGLLALALVTGLARSFARLPSDHRATIAAATAGLAAFAVSATVEWIWDLPAISVAALILVAVLLAGGRRMRPYEDRPPVAARAVLAVLAIAALVAIALPLGGASALRASEQRVASGDLPGALEQARTAANVQPYSAAADLQQALVFERGGDLPSAIAAARSATRHEATNWRTWLVLSRLHARAGNAAAAVATYRRAKRLNPRSPIFKEQ